MRLRDFAIYRLDPDGAHVPSSTFFVQVIFRGLLVRHHVESLNNYGFRVELEDGQPGEAFRIAWRLQYDETEDNQDMPLNTSEHIWPGTREAVVDIPFVGKVAVNPPTSMTLVALLNGEPLATATLEFRWSDNQIG